jgi:hypothetical protein
MPLTDETPAPPIPTDYTVDIAEYTEIYEDLNRAGGYLTAATEDEDGNAIPIEDLVWVQGGGPTRSALAHPDDVEVIEGEAIISLKPKMAAKYQARFERIAERVTLRIKTRSEIRQFRRAAIRRAIRAAEREAERILERQAAREEARRAEREAARQAEREAELTP